MHFFLGAVAVFCALFSGFDATRVRPSDGTVWLLGRPTLEVLDTVARKTGEPTPLRRGDQIVGIANRIVNSPQTAAQVLREQQPGQEVPYLIIRDGEQLQVPVPLTSTRVKLRDYALNVMLAGIFMGIGFWVYLRSNNERPAALFFVLCLLFGLYFMTNQNRVSYYYGAIFVQNIGAFARFMLPASFLHFFLIFPSRKTTILRHPFLTPLLYVLPMMFYAKFTLDQFIGAEGAKISAANWVVLGLYYVLGLSALLHGYFSYRDPLIRERVRILTVGTLAGVIPFLIFKIGLEELGFYQEAARLGILPLAFIPISFGYCVARYQVLQIDLLLKRSLSYALLTAGVWVAYLGSAWFLGGKVLGMVPAAGPLGSAGTTLLVAGLLWPIRARFQKRIETGFHHSRDNMTGLIEEFSKEIPQIIQTETLLSRVGQRLCEVIDLPGLAVYLVESEQDGNVFQLKGSVVGPGRSASLPLDPNLNARHSFGDGPLPPLRALGTEYPPVLEMEHLARALADQREPYWADTVLGDSFEGRQAITREQAEIKARAAEQKRLLDHGIQLLIPLITQERLIGLMALPRRHGDEGYAVHELQLLSIVAGQVALQVENARLYEEEITKQKLEEEMRMARLIQARLLPGTIPCLPGVEITAVNISSKQVSGDYYDMIEREDGQLGIIIADVSGKGMPASILASNIQAALRAQCDTCTSPGEVLERINRQIHASTDPMHFATLFLALYDPEARTLLYSSGGHNPPVLLRSDKSLELLTEGGLPLGAFDFGEYEEGTVTLDDGDLLFLYTDGLTETKGPDGEEDFGEDRLNDMLRDCQEDDMDTLLAGFHAKLRNFSGRQEADDDITMIGLRISERGQANYAATGMGT